MLHKFLYGLLTAVLLTASPAFADAVAKNESGDYVRITQSPCTLPSVSYELRPLFQAGVANIQGKDYKVCWALAQDQVFLLYEDGDQGMIPANAFKKVPEV